MYKTLRYIQLCLLGFTIGVAALASRFLPPVLPSLVLLRPAILVALILNVGWLALYVFHRRGGLAAAEKATLRTGWALVLAGAIAVGSVFILYLITISHKAS
jgi:hypothetical protein